MKIQEQQHQLRYVPLTLWRWAMIGLIAFSSQALAEPVQILDTWDYNSMDGVDYRSVSNGELTVHITSSGNVARTFPPIEYSLADDFTVSVSYSEYSHQGSNPNAIAPVHSEAGISINWESQQVDPVNGDPLTGNLSIWRATWTDGYEHYQSILGLNNGNYAEVKSLEEIPTNDSFGFLSISKAGNSITTTVINSLGQAHSWNYTDSELGIEGNSIWIGIDTANGPYDFTNVHYSGLDMTPSSVPIPAAFWLFGSALAGLCGIRSLVGRA